MPAQDLVWAASTAVLTCLLVVVIRSNNNNRRQSSAPSASTSAPSASAPTTAPQEHFEVVVSPADKFKFNAAHFIAFQGFRERLHGHNYTVGVRLVGSAVQSDGYVMDYGEIKSICGRICKDELNERFLLPLHSDVLKITFCDGGKVVKMECEVDGSRFELPRDDCAELPIVHSSTEELAVFLWHRIVHDFTQEKLTARGIYAMEVSVAEMPHQKAVYRRSLLLNDNSLNNELQRVEAPTRGCLCHSS